MSRGRDPRPRPRRRARSTCARARALGRGVFLLSAHFGGWELGAIRGGLHRRADRARRAPARQPATSSEELARRRTRFGNRLDRQARRGARHPAGDPRAARPSRSSWTRTCSRARPSSSRSSGGSRRRPRRSRSSSCKTDAPVVPASCWPEGGGRYALELERADPRRGVPAAGRDRDEAVRRATARYMEVTEAAIRTEPEAWLWMHNRWRTRPPRTRSREAAVIAPNWIGDAVMSLPVPARAAARRTRATASRVLARRGPGGDLPGRGQRRRGPARASSFLADVAAPARAADSTRRGCCPTPSAPR